MHVSVIGPGAVGIFLIQRLLRAGVRAQCVGRHGPIAVRETFLAIDGPVEISLPAGTAQDLAHTDLIFVAVKAFDLAAALEWTRLARPGTPIIVTVNGAIHQVIEAEQGRRPHLLWRLGSCTYGISRASTGPFEQRSKLGGIQCGPLKEGERPTTVEEQLLPLEPEIFTWCPEMITVYRRKWLYNTVINTLCAVRRLPRNGELLRDLETLSAVFNEAYSLGTQHWGPWLSDRESLYQGLIQLIEQTQANENSMARDVRLGRRTESRYLAGLAQNPQLYPLLTEFHEQVEGVRDVTSGTTTKFGSV